jgi:hypothetical protein
LPDEGQRQIAAKVQEQQTELMIYARQQIQFLTDPIGGQDKSFLFLRYVLGVGIDNDSI